MVRSMTGYGRGEAVADDLRITVEVRSVNNRYLDCSFKLPRAYLFVESALKERTQSRVGRGKVDVLVNLERTAESDLAVTVNEPVAKAYIEAMRRLCEMDGRVGESYSPADLAHFPDVLLLEKKEEDAESVRIGILEALDQALGSLNGMRETEGARLRADVEGRADTVAALLARVEERAPEITEDYRTRLLTRLREVLGDVQIDEGRLLTEAAIYAEKVAVDEEVVRLHSHLGQLREMFAVGGAVGRKLDFLIQEMNREANTIGSKCGDMETSRLVVDIKAEIEKIREQVQNLE